jgi:hypothetical protein
LIEALEMQRELKTCKFYSIHTIFSTSFSKQFLINLGQTQWKLLVSFIPVHQTALRFECLVAVRHFGRFPRYGPTSLSVRILKFRPRVHFLGLRRSPRYLEWSAVD